MRKLVSVRLAGAAGADAFPAITAGKRPRDLCRTVIAGAHGQPPLLLSVAIEGGSSVVKKGHPERWRLSDHGRWQKIHLGALEAAYGNTAYFPHLFPKLAEILDQTAAGDSFAELTLALHRVMMDFIGAESFIRDYVRLDDRSKERLAVIAKENLTFGNDDLAFIDVIFKKGPESLLYVCSQ